MSDGLTKESLEASLRIIESLLESPQLELPVLRPGALWCKLDPKTGVLHVGKDKSVPDVVHEYLKGKALATHAYHHANPRIFERLYVEGNQKHKTASQLAWDLNYRPEYEGLTAVVSSVPVATGLGYVERTLGAEQSQFARTCVQQTIATIQHSSSSLVQLERQGSLDALAWHTIGASWLPRLARVSSMQEYRLLVKEAGIASGILTI